MGGIIRRFTLFPIKVRFVQFAQWLSFSLLTVYTLKGCYVVLEKNFNFNLNSQFP